MSNSRKLKRAVQELGGYYGVNSRADYLQQVIYGDDSDTKKTQVILTGLYGNGADLAAPEDFETQVQTSVNASLSVIANVLDDALYTHEIIASLIKSQKDGETGTTPMPDNLYSSLFTVISSQHAWPADSAFDRSNPKAFHGPYMLDCISSDWNPLNEEEGQNINKNKNMPPTKTQPAASWVMIKSPHLTFGTNELSSTQLFMNAIPVLEWSRAYPYFEMRVITEGRPVDSGFRPQGMSLIRFLQGTSPVPVETSDGFLNPDYLLAVAQPEEIATQANLAINATDIQDLYGLDVVIDIGAAAHATAADSDTALSAAGMEIFTSPQTLVPGDEPYVDFDSIGFDAPAADPSSGAPLDQIPGTSGSPRPAPVLDKFQPLFSIQSFDISVKGSGHGMMATKAAKCVITLHDRSRLAEIAPLIKPDVYKNTEILLHYGWSHPEGGTGQNAYADFIDANRVKEKYGIYNSQFAFKPNGSVDISLTMVTKGSAQLDWTEISITPDVASKWQAVETLIQTVAVTRQTALTPSMKNVTGTSVIASISGTNIGDVFSGKKLKELNSWISGMDKADAGSTNAEIGKLIETLRSLKSELSSFNTTAGAAIDKKKKRLTSRNFTSNTQIDKYQPSTSNGSEKSPDPWFFPANGENTEFSAGKMGRTTVFMLSGISTPPWAKAGASTTEYVSLGKLISIFVIEPLIGSNRFEEVQCYSYSFNMYSSWMRGQNIGSFPIKVSSFKSKLDDLMKKFPQISCQRFISFIALQFVNSMSNEAYGFSKLFTTKNGKTTIVDKKPGAFSSKKDKILKDAYGGKGDIKFKCPAFGMYVECVPHSTYSTDHGGLSLNINQNGNAATILRFHFFDQNTSVNEGLSALLKANRNSEIGAISADLSETIRKGTNKNSPEEQIKSTIELAIKKKLVEGPHEDADGNQFYSITGGPPAIKNMIKSQMAYIQPGVQSSPIQNFQIQTQHDAKLATIHMLAAGQSGGGSDAAPGEQDRGLPLRMNPAAANIQMLGCPLLSYGQQYFVDMGTNTTIDNIYAVTSIDHKLSPGKFTTTAKLVPQDAWGEYQSFEQQVNAAQAIVSQYADGTFEWPAEPPPKPPKKKRKKAPKPKPSSVQAGRYADRDMPAF